MRIESSRRRTAIGESPRALFKVLCAPYNSFPLLCSAFCLVRLSDPKWLGQRWMREERARMPRRVVGRPRAMQTLSRRDNLQNQAEQQQQQQSSDKSRLKLGAPKKERSKFVRRQKLKVSSSSSSSRRIEQPTNESMLLLAPSLRHHHFCKSKCQ